MFLRQKRKILSTLSGFALSTCMAFGQTGEPISVTRSEQTAENQKSVEVQLPSVVVPAPMPGTTPVAEPTQPVQNIQPAPVAQPMTEGKAIGLVPVTPAEAEDPIKKLQKRIEELEKNKGGTTDKKALDKAVQDAMKAEQEKQAKKKAEEDEKKKAEEEAKKKQEEEEGIEIGSNMILNASWKNGFTSSTPDGSYRFHIGGRAQMDAGGYNANQGFQTSLGDFALVQGADFRRLRLRMDGAFHDNFEFMTEVELSNASDNRKNSNDPKANLFLTDVWLAIHDLPVIDTLRIGHQKEYMTFANATSSRFLPFLERPYIFDAFEDDFQFADGITMNRNLFDQHMSVWAGFFKTETRTGAFGTGNGYQGTGRLTWMPIINDEAGEWLNFSLAASHSAVDKNGEQLTVRPLFRQGVSFQVPNLLKIDSYYSADGLNLLSSGFHSAWGPFTLGGEWMCQQEGNAFHGGPGNYLPNGQLPSGVKSVGNLFFDGYYVEALYFLTSGDTRPCNKIIPGYDRITPKEDFFASHGAWGWGAWEIGARYDYVTLNSGVVKGGTLQSETAVLNWYWNSQAKVQFTYIYTFRDMGSQKGTGDFGAGGMRFAWDF